MASTYTSNIRLEKQADGENPNAWGAILNTNVIDLVDQAVAAYQIVSVSGTTPITLTQVNGATDQSRKAILSFDGTLTAETSIIIPSVNKMYYVRNNTSGSFALKIKTAGNTAITVEQGSNVMVASDGTDVYKTAFPTSVSSFTANSLTATSISTSVLDVTQVSATAIHATSVSAVSGRFSGTVSASAFDGLGNQLSFGSDAQGDIYYYAGNSIARLAAGTNGFLLKTQGSGANPTWTAPGQTVIKETNAYVTVGNTGVNFDSSQMLITEGSHITQLETSVTPQQSGSKIEVNVNVNIGCANASDLLAVGLFENSATSAVAVVVGNGTGNLVLSKNFTLKYFTSTSNTNAIQYSVRSGSSDGSGIFLNGGTTQRFSNQLISSVIITEHT